MKKVLLLGASGNIGSQTLDVLRKRGLDFVLTSFSVGNNYKAAESILRRFIFVKDVYLIDESKAKLLKKKFPFVNFYSGEKGLSEMIKNCSFDLCVNALVGFAGLEPSYLVLKRNKILCLANKEALVVGGELLNGLLKKGFGKIYPIDSEHCALHKLLRKVSPDKVDSLVLTASGGALRSWKIEDLDKAKKEDALKHPTWNMGTKITIDCATMINKGFEFIEAYYLFDFPPEKIKIKMHDESLVHSYIILKNGKLMCDYGVPDMRKAIEYAMCEGKVPYKVVTVKSLSELKDCHFHDYDPKRYPLAELAINCIKNGDVGARIALNASNEIAVNAFLNDKITYTQLINTVQFVTTNQLDVVVKSLKDIKRFDKNIRNLTEGVINNYGSI